MGSVCRVRVGMGAIACAAAMLALMMPSMSSAASTHSWKSGVFAGYGPWQDEEFQAWRGATVQTATDYMEWSNWSEIEDPSWDIASWEQDPNIKVVMTIPMWAATGGSLSAAAAGQYNTYYATMAKSLIAGGLGSSIIRLGWEFNGNWYPWSALNATEAAQYAAAWRQEVGAIKSVKGGHFTFDWSMTVDDGGINPALAYPGDTYVDYIGMDVYDWDEYTGLTGAQRWNDIVNNGYGLAWQASFAAQHKKPISFAEWALADNPSSPSTSGGDDPAFIQNMYNWFSTHNTAFEDYFDTDANGDDFGMTTCNGEFPNATAKYLQLFGSGSANPSITTTGCTSTTTSNTANTGGTAKAAVASEAASVPTAGTAVRTSAAKFQLASTPKIR
jgi:beta-mannanase